MAAHQGRLAQGLARVSGRAARAGNPLGGVPPAGAMIFLLVEETSPALTPLSAGTSVMVALLAFVLAGLAFAAMRRRGNPSLKWVAFAFVVFGVKNVFSAYNVVSHVVPHDAIELVLSLFDLALLLLLLIPFLRRRRA